MSLGIVQENINVLAPFDNFNLHSNLSSRFHLIPTLGAWLWAQLSLGWLTQGFCLSYINICTLIRYINTYINDPNDPHWIQYGHKNSIDPAKHRQCKSPQGILLSRADWWSSRVDWSYPIYDIQYVNLYLIYLKN